MPTGESPSPRQPLYDYELAGDYLNTTKRHLRDLVCRGEIPNVKVGKLVRFRPEDLDEWLAKNTRAAS
jgi:excisionase family DNA binding protein